MKIENNLQMAISSIKYLNLRINKNVNANIPAEISVSVIHNFILLRRLRICWLDALKISGLRILLFPVVAVLILLGWVLMVIGERQECNEAVTKLKNADFGLAEKPSENADEVEMGSIDKIEEESVC